MMIKDIRLLLSLCFVMFVFAGFARAEEAEPGATLSKIAESGTIYVAIRESAIPFSYVLEDKETPAGYSWEICQHIVKAVEARLGKPVKTVPVTVSTSGRLMMVKTGMADIECGSTTNTVGRQRQVAFSNTIFVSEVRIMARADGDIKQTADLNGKSVVTTRGTTAERLVRMIAIQGNLSVNQKVGGNNTESMSMLERGEVDAFVSDDALLLGARSLSKNPEQFVLLPRVSTIIEPYGLVIRNDDPEFKKLVDETLIQLFKSGEIEQIYDRWFNQPIPPDQKVLGLPLSDLNKAAFANPNDKPVN